MEEKRKIKTIGEPGKNTATITEEKKSAHSLSAMHAKNLVSQAGEAHKVPGSRYLGSACVHFYANETMPDHPNYFCVSHLFLDGVAEPHADIGIKALKQSVMKHFGRNIPKERL